ncbi:hypothetical protein OIU84_028319 [Salix udensis]|uniref:Uncharacterized protein n=1 Tax=Salix udensis TaxID=889485 RepID=A0AAD6PA24_9ROSI|nr:hypothetical protein OIU84_028319 [Salix udensis]
MGSVLCFSVFWTSGFWCRFCLFIAFVSSFSSLL